MKLQLLAFLILISVTRSIKILKNEINFNACNSSYFNHISNNSKHESNFCVIPMKKSKN